MWRLLTRIVLPKGSFKLAPYVPISLAYFDMVLKEEYLPRIQEGLYQENVFLKYLSK